jgi:hypothetical protein
MFQKLGDIASAKPTTVPCIYVGQAPSTPLTHAEKKAIEAQAHAYNTRMREPGQHQGPLTAATLRVLHALLWTFHNTEHGYCWPSLRKLAAAARCCRDTAHEAIKALRAAGFLRWWHQFKRKTIGRLTALFRTSNAYTFHQVVAPVSVKSQRTENQDARTGAGEEKKIGASQVDIGKIRATSPELEAALARLMALKPEGVGRNGP